ncbi:MAG: RNA-guided endonuclease InsQ/TnpB family protein, partial [Desulfurococcaceae archaeon]
MIRKNSTDNTAAPPLQGGGGGAKGRKASSASRKHRRKRCQLFVRAPAPAEPGGAEGEGPVTDEMCSLVETGGVRVIILRLKPGSEVERELEALADATAKMYNEVNFILRKLFFNGYFSWERASRVLKAFYRAYCWGLLGRPRLGYHIADAVKQQLLNDWQSFFGLLREKREGKLPGWLKPRPPGYKKDKVTGEREKIFFVRNRGYRIVPENGKRGKLVISVAGKWISLAYHGRMLWKGKQGTLIIKEAGGRWYAYVPVNVGVPAPADRKYMYVNGERDRVQVHEPRGSHKAFVDLGINNLMAVVTTSGRALLYRGGPVKAEHEYWSKEASIYQKVRDFCKNHGLPWEKWHHLYLRAYEKRGRRTRNLKRNAVSHLVKLLWEEGVDTVYVGLPYDIIHEKGNKYSVNVWGYRKITKWLSEAAAEYGIKVYAINEYKTSITCSRCGYESKEARIHRGLYKCPHCGLEINADINAALNIARKAGYTPPTPSKIEAFIPTHQGVTPLNEKEKSTRPETITPRRVTGRHA